MRKMILFPVAFVSLMGATTADAQIWPLRPYSSSPSGKSAPASWNPQAAMVSQSGTDTIYFTRRGMTLDPNSERVLAAEARWLIANPMITARIEGHADLQDTRSYAVALGEERAAVVRDFLVIHGVAPDRLKVVSWGKEHPGSVQVGPTTLTVGARVVTVVSDSGRPALLGRR